MWDAQSFGELKTEREKMIGCDFILLLRIVESWAHLFMKEKSPFRGRNYSCK